MKDFDNESIPIIINDDEVSPRRNSRQKVMLTSIIGLLAVVACSVAVVSFHSKIRHSHRLVDFGANSIEQNEQTKRGNHPDCPIQPFDYLMFVWRWAPSVCLTDPCVPNPPESWLIHGLWPNFYNGTWPQFCCKPDKFDVKKVKDLEPEMLVKWSNLEKGKGVDSLWAHEWEKHGTCSYQSKIILGEKKYFGQTLGLFNKWPVQQWLTDAGITPSNSTIVTEKALLDAIKPYIPNVLEIHCENVKHGGETKRIDEIHVCVDKTTLTPIDCPTPKDTCASGFIYPQSG